MYTHDTLANPDSRSIVTRMPTGERNEDGEAILVLQTRYSKGRKIIDSDVYMERLTDSGFYTRSFTMFQRSVGSGVTIIRDSMLRFSQAKARAQHEEALRLLSTRSVLVGSTDAVEAELARLLHLAMTTV